MSERPGEARLRRALGRLHRPLPAGEGGRASRAPLSVGPTNPFEVAVAERLRALESELDQLRTRINWLLTVIVGAAVTNIVIALVK